jgi:hypothetical protein
MTDVASRPRQGTGTPLATEQGEPERRGFRPSARRRNRIVTGAVLAALAVAGNVWLYSNVDSDQQVLQVTRDVTAGEQITEDMLRSVDAELDDSVTVVPAGQLGATIGRYTKVRLIAGSLVTPASLQAEPLVTDGASVVAVRVPDGSLPIGLRERVPVDIVLPPGATAVAAEASEPHVVEGRVIGLPSTPDSTVGLVSVSLEVDASEASRVAAADDVRLVLRQPVEDPAPTEVDGP